VAGGSLGYQTHIASVTEYMAIDPALDQGIHFNFAIDNVYFGWRARERSQFWGFRSLITDSLAPPSTKIRTHLSQI